MTSATSSGRPGRAMGVKGGEVAAASREPARGLFVSGVSMNPGATLFLYVSVTGREASRLERGVGWATVDRRRGQE